MTNFSRFQIIDFENRLKSLKTESLLTDYKRYNIYHIKQVNQIAFAKIDFRHV
jgi:hypothetical protein